MAAGTWALAARAEKPLRLLAVLVLVLLIVAALAQEWGTLLAWFAAVGLACLLFNLISMGVGYGAPRLLKLPKRQAIAIAMEIGIHNRAQRTPEPRDVGTGGDLRPDDVLHRRGDGGMAEPATSSGCRRGRLRHTGYPSTASAVSISSGVL